MPKIASHIYKARQSYVLQRAVPSDVRQIVCKATWKEAGGKTLNEARARLPGFLARTDREIAIARGELLLTPDEQIDRLPLTAALDDPDVQQLLLEGAEVDPDLSQAQRERMVAVVKGDLIPDPIYTAKDLIAIATRLKQPARRTRESWAKELDLFMRFCGVSSPLSCTKKHAAAYRTQLLERLSPNTAKTTLNYLSGLWSILEEVKPGTEHVFRGLAKRIKVVKKSREEVVNPIESWNGSIYLPVFKILYYTGARLGEIAGLRSDDILEDRILIRPNEERTLKTGASQREIPIHPQLTEILLPIRTRVGFIWPQLQNADGRWGHNLSTPCKKLTGVTPHALRHRVATRLREENFNESTIGKLLGHEPNNVTGGYGSVPWARLVEAVNSL
ncbi:MAG: integrase [Cyanobacteria bacterium K_DeepCast_0m_m1_088]|nr:integrase [Cyanobacteria bacterium K_DeepCast_0m_m1_088]